MWNAECGMRNKKLNGTQMNTDKHRFYIRQRVKDKRPNGTRMNTDKHGSFLKKKTETERPSYSPAKPRSIRLILTARPFQKSPFAPLF
jgi:hypothetical protein